MASGTLELAPPNEGGDDRQESVAAIRHAELAVAAGGLLLEAPTPTETLTDAMIEDFLERETADRTERTEPGEESPQEVVTLGGRALFVEGSENYGFKGSPVLGRVMPGGIRSRVAGVEGRAFRPRSSNAYMGRQAITNYVTRVAVI